MKITVNDETRVTVYLPVENINPGSAITCPDRAAMQPIIDAYIAEVKKEPGVLDVILVSVQCDWIVSFFAGTAGLSSHPANLPYARSY